MLRAQTLAAREPRRPHGTRRVCRHSLCRRCAGGSLRDAINRADENGDSNNVITLAAGTYALTDVADGNLLIEDKAGGVAEKSLTIVGQGTASTIVESQAGGASGYRVFEVGAPPGQACRCCFRT